MTTQVITDRETGREVAVSCGPIPVLDLTLDDTSRARSFEDMLGRRAAELAMPAPVRSDYRYRVTLERYLGWEEPKVAEVRREFDALLDVHASMSQRQIDEIWSRRRLEVRGRGVRAAVAGVTCPACGASDSAAAHFCTSCGGALTPTAIFEGEGPGDTAGCPACGRNNPDGSAFCAACGRPIPTAEGGPIIQASARPRRSIRGGVRLVASKSFRFVNRYTRKVESVREGITYCSSDAECYKADPSAWAIAS
jgi:hypothetical protein